MNGNHQFYNQVLIERMGKGLEILEVSPRSGGCINNAVLIKSSKGNFFIKWQQGLPEDMFQKEAKGLKLLKEANKIKVPETFGYGKIENKDYLLMEFIESGKRQNDFWANFGSSLAQLHRNGNYNYGLDHHNYIGKLPQCNDFIDNWVDFFIERRLEVQLRLAREKNLIDESFVKRFKKIYAKLSGILPEYSPSLLHGDLWSGNVMVGKDGYVVVIDPAVYYGNREIELAFTKLFGGFDDEFYQAYNNKYPVAPGFEERVDIYNLYPLMVHVNLFGLSYLSGVNRTIKKLQ